MPAFRDMKGREVDVATGEVVGAPPRRRPGESRPADAPTPRVRVPKFDADGLTEREAAIIRVAKAAGASTVPTPEQLIAERDPDDPMLLEDEQDDEVQDDLEDLPLQGVTPPALISRAPEPHSTRVPAAPRGAIPPATIDVLNGIIALAERVSEDAANLHRKAVTFRDALQRDANDKAALARQLAALIDTAPGG